MSDFNESYKNFTAIFAQKNLRFEKIRKKIFCTKLIKKSNLTKDLAVQQQPSKCI